jgi:chromatin remodeling complex protein RSC6
MVRATKTEKPTTASMPVVATAPVAAPVSVEVKPKKTASAKKEKAVVETTPVPVVVDAEPAAAATKIEVSSNSASKFVELTTKVQQLTAVLSSIKADLKVLEKTVAKEQKIAQKNSKTARKSSGNRNPSGFAKPTKISDALASFLGRASGVEMARTEVSKEITRYIKENNLQLATNKRIITPDNKLAVLLNYKEGTEPLSYFNLQKYISPHFIKAVPAVVPAL